MVSGFELGGWQQFTKALESDSKAMDHGGIDIVHVNPFECNLWTTWEFPAIDVPETFTNIAGLRAKSRKPQKTKGETRNEGGLSCR